MRARESEGKVHMRGMSRNRLGWLGGWKGDEEGTGLQCPQIGRQYAIKNKAAIAFQYISFVFIDRFIVICSKMDPM